MTDDLVRAVLLTMAVPGLVVGLVLGLKRGIVGTLISGVIGLVGGVGGGLALGALATQLKLGPPFNGPIGVVGGSIIGASVLVGLTSLVRRP